jgi:hypothetical protein
MLLMWYFSYYKEFKLSTLENSGKNKKKKELNSFHT